MASSWKSAVRYLGGTEARERELLDRMALEIQQVVAALTAENGGVPHRALHAKPLATFERASFSVSRELSADFQAGVLQPGASFDALVRFSNAAGVVHQKDSDPDLRGAAVRVLATPAHDWMMTNAECHHARDAAEAMALTVAFARKGFFRRLVGRRGAAIDGLMGLAARVGPVGALRIVRAVKRQMAIPVESLATETFWSRAPLRINDTVVKYRLSPAATKSTAPVAAADLTAELSARLATSDVGFYLQVQRYADERATPLEDASVPWTTPHETVATLVLPRGTDFAPSVGGDAMAFSPWQVSGPAFEPLGSMNRARRVVYPAAARARQP